MAEWIPKTNGWLGRDTAAPLPPVTPAPVIEPSEYFQTITIPILRCPRESCHSRDGLRCYGTVRPVLYYRCGICGAKFKVMEVEMATFQISEPVS